jgi:hypothetical protein
MPEISLFSDSEINSTDHTLVNRESAINPASLSI